MSIFKLISHPVHRWFTLLKGEPAMNRVDAPNGRQYIKSKGEGMRRGSFRHRWLTVLYALALLLAALPTRPLQAAETAISVDCTSIAVVPAELCSAIQQALIRDSGLLPSDRAYTVSSLRQTDTWALAVLVPTRVVQAHWDGFTNQDLIEVLAYRPTSGGWEAGVAGSSTYTRLMEAVPNSFIEQKSPDISLTSAPAFLFPWSQPQYWYKTQGWHGGNAIDLQPVNRSNPPVDFAVLAAAEGRLELACDDGTTATLSITHGDGSKTSYLHLRASTLKREFLGKQIARGQFLAELYSTGAGAGGEFRFGCGWGTAAHLHFVLPSRNVGINGYSAESVANAAFATKFQSSNQRIDGCAISVGDGTSRPQMFIDAYNRKGGRAILGCPANGVHWWGDGDRAFTIQDFRGGLVGDAAIIHDENRDSPMNSIPAYVVQGGVWQYYIQLGGWQSWLGPPTSDEFTNETGQAQSNFRNGYINYRGGNPEAVAWPSPVAQQWRAEYHNGTNTSGFPTWVRNESVIDNDWGDGAPGSGRWGVWPDNFSVRWSGNFGFEGGTYTFTADVDDGVRIWVDGELIIDRWQIQPGSYQASRTLAAGSHTVRVDSFEAGGGAITRFSWALVPNQPPLAPSNLLVSKTDQRAVALTWQDQSANESGFKIYKWGTQQGKADFYEFARVGANQSSFTDSNLSCQSDYYYQVSAYNSYGESSRTGWVKATTALCPVAMPSNLQVASVTTSTITLGWQDTATNEAGFKIYRWGNQGGVWEFYYWASVGPNVTAFVDRNLSCSTDYFYQVSSYNATDESNRAGWIKGTTPPCSPSTSETHPSSSPPEPVYPDLQGSQSQIYLPLILR